MHNIPLSAWVVMAIVAILVIILYFALFTIMRDPAKFREITQSKMDRSGQSAQDLHKVSEALRHPFAGESKQLDELSNIVHDLKEPPSIPSTHIPDDADQEINKSVDQ